MAPYIRLLIIAFIVSYIISYLSKKILKKEVIFSQIFLISLIFAVSVVLFLYLLELLITSIL